MNIDNGAENDDPAPVYTDPYCGLLSINLGPRWTDTELNAHIVEAVKYGIRMERARILNSTKDLSYEV